MSLTAAEPVTPFCLFAVRIERIEDLSPSFRRFTLSGDDLQHFADNGFDQRIKLILPLEGLGITPLPARQDWYAAWRELPDELRNPIRTYTARKARVAEREIDVDVVVHPVSGPASRWAENAVIGSELVISGPNARHDGPHGGVDFLPPAHTDMILLAGDETSLPAIASILERLPREARGTALIEVPHGGDSVCVPSHPGFTVRVLGRHGLPSGQLLLDAVRETAHRLVRGSAPADVGELVDVDVDADLLWEVPSDDHGGPAREETALYSWLAGEAGVIKALRRHLVSDLGIDRKTVAFMGYWRLGRSEN